MIQTPECHLVYEGKESDESVLTNTPSASLCKITAFGKSVKLADSNVWTNMLVLGDNLQVLKAMLGNPSIKGRVRLVYIDPPFSTNHEFRGGSKRTSTISYSRGDEPAYKDTLTGSVYLEFLRKRLIMLKEILAEDGSIYVHIDWKKGHYVKVLLDEIFGKEHFINDIARVKCNPKNFRRAAYGNIKDMILLYSKTDDYVWHESLEDYSKEDILKLFPKVDKKGRRYTTNPLHAPGETANGPTGQPWHGIKPPRGRHWRYAPEVLEDLDTQGLIEWSATNNPRKKIYAEDYMKKKKKRQDIWELKDPAYPLYPTQKNLEMLKVIIAASSSSNNLVLDCFAGSGTTLLAAEQLSRRWIGIDDSPLAIEVTMKRLMEHKSLAAFAFYNASNQPLHPTIRGIIQTNRIQ